MAGDLRIQVGIAGWSNPPATRDERPAGRSHLAFYADHFSCVEINSSFYRSHQSATYAKWREATPPTFRFSVKMPGSITHDGQLKRCADDVARFYGDVAHLGPKLKVILVQLPPGLEYTPRTVRAFFGKVPPPRGARVVCEPRHASWFSSSADKTLRDLDIPRVAADPARVPNAELPGGATKFAYFRWHGTPHVYYSKYSDTRLGEFADQVATTQARETWCIFDNTARYEAWGDARRFLGSLKAESKPQRLRVGRR